jgi:hypothetical protein
VVDNDGNIIGLGNPVSASNDWVLSPTGLGSSIYIDLLLATPLWGGPGITHYYQAGVNDRRLAQYWANSAGSFLGATRYVDDADDGKYYYGNFGAYAIGTTVCYMYGEQSVSGYTWGQIILDLTGATPVWVTDGGWRWNNYANSVNDLAASTPVNFLYTDASGNMKSGALNSAITRTALGLDSYISSASNGLTETAGDVKLGGTLTDLTIIDLGVSTAGYPLNIGSGSQGAWGGDMPARTGVYMHLHPGAEEATLGWNRLEATTYFDSKYCEMYLGPSYNSWNTLAISATNGNYSSEIRHGPADEGAGSVAGLGTRNLGLLNQGPSGFMKLWANLLGDETGTAPAWQFYGAELYLDDYPESRNDVATYAPINFLYTVGGWVKSGALDSDIFRIAIGLGASNGLTETDGEIKLGGTLTADTVVDPNGHKLLFSASGTDLYSAGMCPAGAHAVLDSATNFADMTASNVTAGDGQQMWSYLTPDDGYAGLGAEEYVSGVLHNYAAFSMYSGTGTSGAYMLYLNASYSGVTGSLTLDCSGATATWNASGEMRWLNYLNSRDDTATSTPINLLYTDSSGNQKSAPLSKVMPNGTAEIDFGAFPGSNEGSVTVTGQTMITAGKNIQLTVSCETSADYTAEDMAWIASLVGLSAGNIVAATSFTIYARSQHEMQGKIKINWAY